MARFAENWFRKQMSTRLVVAFAIFVIILTGAASGEQASERPPEVGEGSLLYRSPVSGRYESMPLVHTDVALDVRGLVAAATVTQQYVKSTAQPLEAVYY